MAKFDFNQYPIDGGAEAAQPQVAPAAKFNFSQYASEESPDAPSADLYSAMGRMTPADEPPTKTSLLEATGEHYGNAATGGYLPQIQGGIAKLKGQPISIMDPASAYLQARDETIKRMQMEEKEHPYGSALGSVGGALTLGAAANAVAPVGAGIGAAEKLGAFGRVVQAARGGAIIGGLSNPGDTEGQLSGPQLGDRAKNAAVGAAVSGGIQGSLEGIEAGTKAIQNSPEIMQGKAEERAFKGSGAMLADYRRAGGKDQVRDIGRFMLDNGMIKPGMTVDEVAEAAGSIRDKAGAELGAAYRNAQAAAEKAGVEIPAANLNPKRLAEEFLEQYKADQSGVAGGGARVRAVQNYVDDFQKLPPNAGIEDVNKFRIGLDRQIFANNKSLATLPEAKQAPLDFRRFIDQRVDAAISAVDRATGGSISQQLPELNQRFGTAKNVASIAEDYVSRQGANRFVSPSDYITGIGGAVMGAMTGDDMAERAKHAAIGGMLGVANHAGRVYGVPLASVGLDKMGAGLGMTPIPALAGAAGSVVNAMKGPASIAAAGAIGQKNQTSPNGVPNPQSQAPSMPTGEDLWAQQGIQKLGIRDPGISNKLISDPKMKQLLIEASDLKPGTKAMQNIMQKIQKGFGQ